MGFQAERVKNVTCPKCERTLDVSTARPLSSILCPDCSTPSVVPARVGSMILTGILGEGTGSIVYRAEDRVLGRTVALKVVKEQDAGTPGHQNGVDEARSLLLVDHPNVVKVYAIDTRRGQPCIIMEMLPGGSLKDVLERGERLSERQTLQVGIDVARGLAETNRRGLLHLDVKPGNIMFGANGRAKVLDFGFAAVSIEDRPGEIIGTPYYVSPEQIRRERADFRADIYGLGATLYHVLTGKPPFEDTSIRKLIVARLKQPPPDARAARPDIGARTAQLLVRMMGMEPSERHRSYSELISEMETALAGVRSQKPAAEPT